MELKPRKLAQRLRDLSRERGPTVLSLGHGEPFDDTQSLYLWPDDEAIEVQGRDFSAKDASRLLFVRRKSRHLKRSGAGLPAIFALSLGESHWIVGIGTVVGQRHLDRFPAIRERVHALWED